MLFNRIEALVGRQISMHELDNPDVSCAGATAEPLG